MILGSEELGIDMSEEDSRLEIGKVIVSTATGQLDLQKLYLAREEIIRFSMRAGNSRNTADGIASELIKAEAGKFLGSTGTAENVADVEREISEAMKDSEAKLKILGDPGGAQSVIERSWVISSSVLAVKLQPKYPDQAGSIVSLWLERLKEPVPKPLNIPVQFQPRGFDVLLRDRGGKNDWKQYFHV